MIGGAGKGAGAWEAPLLDRNRQKVCEPGSRFGLSKRLTRGCVPSSIGKGWEDLLPGCSGKKAVFAPLHWTLFVFVLSGPAHLCCSSAPAPSSLPHLPLGQAVGMMGVIEVGVMGEEDW